MTLDPAGGKMYFSTARAIQRANMDGSMREDLVTSIISSPKDIIFVPAVNKIYWVDFQALKIQRSDPDGTNVEDMIFTEYNPRSITAAGSKIYWSEGGRKKRANYDGTNVETLVDASLSDGLAIDLNGGKMYWTEFNSGSVRRSNLDGSNIEDVITGLSFPTDVALDSNGGKLYLTNGDQVQRANLDGSSLETLISDQRSTQGIDLDLAAGKMYWSDQNASTLQSAHLDGTSAETIVSGLSVPQGIALALPTPTAVEEKPDSPGSFTLEQNYPNPFNPSTTIRYSLNHEADVRLRIYNLLGTELRTLVQGFQHPGTYSFEWQGTDHNGNLVGSGVYYYELTVGEAVAVKTMLFLK
ncbi:MAG: FlgD immunoglobulin-like domain containing protein, partial [Rhodothermales bacterium]